MNFLYDFAFIFVAIFALGFTIFIHELGHFLAARRRGLIIKRFSVGFGPKIFGWEKDGVEYRLSAIPFGGYVALPQLADMGRLEGDNENLSQENPEEKDDSWDEDDAEDEDLDEPEMASKMPKISYADKMIVSVMGAVFNVILAFVLACILSFFGYEVRDSQLTTKIGFVSDTVVRWNPKTKEGDEVVSPAKKAGLKTGDEIVAIDGASVEDFMDIQNRIITGKRWTSDNERRLVDVSVIRDGVKKTIEVNPVVVSNEQFRVIGIHPKETFFIDELSPDMPAIKAGIESGDQIVSIDNQPIHSFRFLVEYLEKTDQNQSVSLKVLKGGENGSEEKFDLIPIEKKLVSNGQIITRKLIGFSPKFKTITTYPNPFVLIMQRVKDMYLTLTGLVSPKSDVKLRNMSGPVGIVNHLSIFAKIGFMKLLWFVVFINVNLAILNLLPIPVLDGGHMLFATIEKVRGQPLPFSLVERSQMIFVVLLFSFMLYVTFFDILRLTPS